MKTVDNDWFGSVGALARLAGVEPGIARRVLFELKPGSRTSIRTVTTIKPEGKPARMIQTDITARIADLSREETEGADWYTLEWERRTAPDPATPQFTNNTEGTTDA